MKYILLISCSFVCFLAKGQTTYFPFPDSSAIWNIEGQGCCILYCPGPPNPNPVLTDQNISYYIQGDTLINGQFYHKLFYSGSVYHHCAVGTFINNWSALTETYGGAFRQDILLKEVYYVSPFSNQECLLYDFKLGVGDTMTGCFNPGSCVIVSSVDSILIGPSFRKRINLATNPLYSLIEGIGSTAGLLEPLCPFEYFADLICFSQNGQALYPDTATNCILTTQIPEISKLIIASVNPNPFHSTSTLTINEDNTIGNILIYDTMGKLVRKQLISGKESIIDRYGLANGIYYLRLNTQNGHVFFTDKILIY